jgi:hypothetical protein
MSHTSDSRTSTNQPEEPPPGDEHSNKSNIDPLQPLVVLELQPQGSLHALIFTHEITSTPDRLPCWTYISRGLATLGQKEIAFTIRRPSADQLMEYPPEPLQWFQILYGLAKDGRFANDLYSRTSFKGSQFFGRSDISMVLYTPPQILGNLPPSVLPQTYLQAIVLTEPEAEVAAKYGILRTLSHLGRVARYFPYPPWIDPKRETVITPADVSTSVLESYPAITVCGVHAVLEGIVLYLFVRPHAVQPLQEALRQIPPDFPFTLHSDLFSEADSCFVWKNGQERPNVICTNTTDRTSLCFLVICPGQSEIGLKLVEDGYVRKSMLMSTV